MLTTFAVVVDRPGLAPVRIGPFIARTNAERYATRLRGQMSRARHVPGTAIDVQDADPRHDHEPARLPTDPWGLADFIDNEVLNEDETDFPSLSARLWAQLGDERAEQLWEDATGWAAPEPATNHRERLIAAAENWQNQRAESGSALMRIAVELWRDGLHNIRRIGQITNLSRTTIYETLRSAGIDPAKRDEN